MQDRVESYSSEATEITGLENRRCQRNTLSIPHLGGYAEHPATAEVTTLLLDRWFVHQGSIDWRLDLQYSDDAKSWRDM